MEVEKMGKSMNSKAQIEDIGSLIEKLDTRDDEEAEEAVQKLSQIGKAAIAPLINVLTDDIPMWLIAKSRQEMNAVKALAKIGEPAVELLKEVLPYKSNAHRALGLIGGEEAFQALINELYRDMRGKGAEAAAEALGDLGDARALNDLKFVQINTTSAEVSRAANYAIAKIERKQIGETEWLKVDKNDPYSQVKRIWEFIEEICDDPLLLETAIAWHTEFVKAMPELPFASEKERGHTWLMLGSLIIYFRNPTIREITAEAITNCKEAEYCFEQCLKYLPKQDISNISSLAVQEYLKRLSKVKPPNLLRRLLLAVKR